MSVNNDYIESNGWTQVLDKLLKRIHRNSQTKLKNNNDDSKLDKLNKVLVIAVCGGKGLGKSTFLRILKKRIVENEENVDLSYLDTDLGQPEFTTPGIVSLRTGLEKADEKSKFPTDSIFIGDNNPSLHPETYIYGIKELINRFYERKNNVEKYPVLLINTHGWNNGLGADLVQAILSHAKVTHVVHLKRTNIAGPVDTLNFDQCATHLHKTFGLQPACTSQITESAQELRFLRFASYFEAMNLVELRRKHPLQVCLDNLNVYTQVDVNNKDTIATNPLLYKRLIGSIVGICCCSKEKIFYCIGLGIVSSIDIKTRNVCIITPITLDIIEDRKPDSIVLGTIKTPLLRWSENNPSSVAGMAELPFLAYGEQCVGVDYNKEISRKNLKRRRLLM